MDTYNQKSTPENAQDLSDEQIVQHYWDREEIAITETDTKYGRYLFKIAYNILNDRLDCEECLNDTYLGAWNSIPPTRPKVFPSFISKITRNVAVDKYRHKSSGKKIPSEFLVSLDELDESIPYEGTLEQERAVAEIAKILNTYLWELKENERFAFVCRYYYSDKIAEIAKMMNVSTRTVLRMLSSMRERLKVTLEKEGYINE